MGVKTADCFPILLADERAHAVAAVHAGWRGTAQRIVMRAVEAMRDSFGTVPADLHAAIGPGIGSCCYEVGPEVAAELGARDRKHVDQAFINRGQLIAAGMAPDRIYLAGLCTKCGAEEFHSFRRDGASAGRMLSVIGVR